MNDDDEMTPPPADPSLLASANRALHLLLGRAERERDEARAALAASRDREAALRDALARLDALYARVDALE